jgi:outer membrane protein OmpA-like peptidoglycan-associated protein
MSSPLSFNSTENFRKKLLVRNLQPYKEGNFTPPSSPGQFGFSIIDYSVVDPGNVNDIGDVQEKVLYPLNQFGPDGGFTDPVDININKNTKSNEGEFPYFSSAPPKTNDESRTDLYVRNQFGPDGGYNGIVEVNEDKGDKSNEGEFPYFSSAPSRTVEQSQKDAFLKNIYGPVNGFDTVITISDIQRIIGPRNTYFKFIASHYNPYSILVSPDPIGSSGLLSQDSALAQIAATSLRNEFQARVAEETYQETLGRINLIDAFRDPYDLLAIATGARSIIEPDWNISVPNNIIGKGLDFISRISGVYSPFSWIPGDYFSPEGRTSFINQAANAITGLFGQRGTLPENLSGSNIFLRNTGQGQKSRLFKNITFNQYRPNYRVGITTGLFAPDENYYIGSRNQEITNIVSPPDELPIDKDGNKVRVPVRGYSELATLYEDQSNNTFKFGLTPNAYINDGNLQGGMSWVPSTNFEGQVGAKYGREGQILRNVTPDPDFDGTVSSQYTFKKGSILDDTQRLIDAANNLGGDAKLQHVGNAINQISKVFNDGINIITKGSRVLSYVDEGGAIVGKEYCRIFAKDTPYATMDDLQKSDGMTTSNRRFEYSVLDNTYNLNIAPIRGNASTNIKSGEVKKYMFSIENLAWRTSNKKGFTYQDLPECERGPFGGRIMWFPPYDLKVSEQNSANWNENEFLGRPEPIYTYNNTKRQGSLSWKIVVDHPSILNAIVDKELQGKTPEIINGVVDSFMAGCRKYDIYELAQRFPQFTYSDIYEILSKSEDIKQVEEAFNELGKTNEQTPPIQQTKIINRNDYSFEFYFDNDIPGPNNATATTSNELYLTSLTNYIGSKTRYQQTASQSQKQPISSFFDTKIDNIKTKSEDLGIKIGDALLAGAEVSISLIGSASSPNTATYNKSLSKRRIDSIKTYILSLKDKNGQPLNNFISNGKLKINEDPRGEEININDINCSTELTGNDKIYSINAMSCRRVRISSLEETYNTPTTQIEEITTEPTTSFTQNNNTNGTPLIKNSSELIRKKEVAKIIVKKLLSECDYFNYIEENAPFVYENIKEKIKYFQPTFHSTTPEGLNSRLTFLQQCIRPGDTIPTIGPDGRPIYNDAKNTSFGTPPICVLRIGDFYHTKIAINQISIQYEPLQFDLNPEGIGVQPMIADINMSFYFIGGQGLKEPVARLQNALSFNYYANTEVYDERSDVTEDRTNINKIVWDGIEDFTPFGINSTSNQEQSNDVGKTIGDVLSTTIISGTPETLSGTTSYKSIMNDFVNTTKEYVDTVTSALEDVNDAYYIGGLRLFTENRKYVKGEVLVVNNITSNVKNIDIFGKPESIVSNINNLFTNLLSDNENESSPFYENINLRNFKNSDIRKYKRNIKSVIDTTRVEYDQFYNVNLNNIVDVQQRLIRIIDKLNFIQLESDGYRIKTNENILFSITGTTDVYPPAPVGLNTLEELISDIDNVSDDIQQFYNKLDDYGIVPTNPSSGITFTNYNFGVFNGNILTPEQIRLFVGLGKKIVEEKNDDLIDRLLGNDLKNDEKWRKYINDILNNLKTNYLSSYELSKQLFISFKTEYLIPNFNSYIPFSPDKTRTFNYIKLTTNPTPINNLFNNLYLNRNIGDDKTFNYKVKLD